MKAIAVIPARLASTRLPRKMLREVGGQPLIVRVYKAVQGSLEDVIVATDSEEILQVCRSHDCRVQMTSISHRSGTERVHEISKSVSADIYLNIQGDEPLIRAEHILALIDLMSGPKVEVGTLKTAVEPAGIRNPNVVKVVTASNGQALYFSRGVIPYDRDGKGAHYFKHLGFYAYRKLALDEFVALPESTLEREEKLEQLRFLENGIPIQVRETTYDTVGIDTEEDLRTVERILSHRT